MSWHWKLYSTLRILSAKYVLYCNKSTYSHYVNSWYSLSGLRISSAVVHSCWHSSDTETFVVRLLNGSRSANCADGAEIGARFYLIRTVWNCGLAYRLYRRLSHRVLRDPPEMKIQIMIKIWEIIKNTLLQSNAWTPILIYYKISVIHVVFQRTHYF